MRAWLKHTPRDHAQKRPFFFFTRVTGPRRSLSPKLSDTRVYESQIQAHEQKPLRMGSKAKAAASRMSAIGSLEGSVAGQ